ncbi:MAG: hypothetical protein BGO26_13800 [Actinobacteria bacterium 69-20]|nr:MAG: hypothetical protein BGO26_13800 [Actinobacteria bacterium 69-20]
MPPGVGVPSQTLETLLAVVPDEDELALWVSDAEPDEVEPAELLPADEFDVDAGAPELEQAATVIATMAANATAMAFDFFTEDSSWLVSLPLRYDVCDWMRPR